MARESATGCPATLAEAVTEWIYHEYRRHVPLDGHYIAKLERGAVRRAGGLGQGLA